MNKPVSELTDAEVLQLSGHGKYGPGIIGKELHERASKIIKATGGGILGPAIIDPDYAKKQAARRVAAATNAVADGIENDQYDPDDDESDDATDPWAHVTLSGAKILAQRASVSYIPRVRRGDLIEELIRAKVEPPAPVEDDDDDPDA